MARQRVLITDFSAGMVSSRVMGRLDIPYAQKAVQELDGFIVRPDGGISRRRGTIMVRTGLGITPHDDGLFGDKSIPGFAVVRRGDQVPTYTERPWLIWIEEGSPPKLKAQHMQTRAVTEVSSATLESGEPIEITDTFYSEPDADTVVDEENQYIYMVTPAVSHTVHLGASAWSVQEQERRELAVIHQNRLIAVNRAEGIIWMSIPLHMFSMDPVENITVTEASDGEEETANVFVDHRIDTRLEYNDPEDIESGTRDVESSSLVDYEAKVGRHWTFAALAENGDKALYAVWYECAVDDWTSTQPPDGCGGDGAQCHTMIKVTIAVADTPAQVWTKTYNALVAATIANVTIEQHEVPYVGQQPTDYIIRIIQSHKGRVPVANRGDTGWRVPQRMVVGQDPSDAVVFPILTGAIEMIPDFYGAERVRWIAAQETVYLGTDSGEYQIVSAFPYFSTDPGGVIVQAVSRVGTDGCTFMGPSAVLRQEDRLLRLVSNGVNHQAISMTDLLPNAEIIHHRAIEYGSHRYLIALDIMRDLYVMTENQSGQVSGWAIIARDVWWFATYHQDLYIARVRDGVFIVEMLPLDSLYYPGNRSSRERQQFNAIPIHADHGAFLTVATTITYRDTLPRDAQLSVIVWNGESWDHITTGLSTNESGIIADGIENVQEFVGYVDTPVQIYVYESSAVPASSLKTLPLHIPTALGPSLGNRGTVRDVVAIVHESRGMRVRANAGDWETWTSEEPYSGPVSFRVDAGYDETVEVEIESIGALPLTISSLQADVEMSE